MNGVIERATLGGGCFWCLDAVFRPIIGVAEVVSGYAGGITDDPDYEQVCSGRTGHAEVVQLGFDPEIIGYDDVLRIFFATHDPTTMNRQGHDVGTQYRSIILTHSDEQRRTAEGIIAETTAAGLWPGRIVTEIEPLRVFYPAEPYHQDYFANNPAAGYCRVVIAPKLAKFRRDFAARLRPPS